MCHKIVAPPPSPDPPITIRIHIYPLAPRLGDLVRLTCTAASFPESSFIWVKVEDGEDVVVMERSGVMVRKGDDIVVVYVATVSVPNQTFDGNGTLQFSMVQREDEGDYKCTADNGYGSISTESRRLHVAG